MKQEELLDFEEKKGKRNIKKPLIIGGLAFLVFVGGVIGYALISNKDDNVVLPPKVAPKSNFKEVPIQESKEQVQESKEQKEKSPSIKIEDIVKEEPKKEKIQKEIKEVKVSNIKPTPLKSKLQHSKKVKNNIRYYVQVLALLRHSSPSKKFLALIKKEGFDYTFYRTYYIKGGKKIPVTKVLIGPFKNEKIAREQLRIIRERITKNSFLFKVK